MKKEVKNQKMTMDKLAILVAKGFVGIGKRMATKDDLKNLETRMEAKMATKDTVQVMLKEITAIHEDTKSFRDNISTLYTDHVAYDRKIDNLIVRVEKLEIKK